MKLHSVRATSRDVAAIRSIAAADLTGLRSASQPSPDRDLELCLATLLAKVEDGTTVGYIMVSDRVDGQDVDAILQDVQDAADGLVSTGNTCVLKAVGVHPLVEGHRGAVLHHLFRAAFSALPDVDHLVAVGQPKSPLVLHEPLAQHFLHVPLESHRSVFVCPRQRVLPTMFVRSARVEDFDDLVPVFAAQSEVVKERFGEFFLAEAIEARDTNNVVMVGEGPDGRAVGLLAATRSSTGVNLPTLQSSFDLSAFGHLWKGRPEVEALGARVAQLEARLANDWYGVLSAHSDELEPLFDSLPVVNDLTVRGGGSGGDLGGSDDDTAVGQPVLITPAQQAPGGVMQESEVPLDAEAVYVSDVVSLFDAKGDAWGYAGVAGVRLGTLMMTDLGLPQRAEKREGHARRQCRTAVTRTALNTAVSDFALRREGVHTRARVAAWYTWSPDSGEGEDEGGASASGSGRPSSARPASAKPAPGGAGAAGGAPSAAPLHPAGPPPGRHVVMQEFDKAEASRIQERKEGLREAQQALVSAQKEVDASSAADRAAHEAALKDKSDKEIAERKAAGGKAAAKKPDPAAAGSSMFKPVAAPKSPATAAAEGKLESAQKAVGVAQGAMTAPLRVPLLALAAAINSRLHADYVPAQSRLPPGDVYTAEDLGGVGGPASELLLDLLPFLPLAKVQVVAELTPPGAKTAYADTSDDGAVPNPSLTKQVFHAAVGLWEAKALPAATSGVVTVTSVLGPQYTLSPAPVGTPALEPTRGEEAVAEVAASLLHLPRLHLPTFLAGAAVAYTEQERVRAEEEAKRKEAEEKKRKKEEEEAKKALMSGKTATKEEKEKKKEEKKGHTTAEDKNRLVNPSTNPCGAVVQHLKSSASYLGGFILTGLPAHDAAACKALADAMTAAHFPITLNLHATEAVSETVTASGRPASARRPSAAGTPRSASAGSLHVPSGAVVGRDHVRRTSIFANERLMQGALQRRNSFVLAEVRQAERFVAGAPLALLPAHIPGAPWGGPLGHTLHVDADEVHLLNEAMRRGGGRRAPGAEDGTVPLPDLLREQVLGILLREGALRTDVTALEGEEEGASAADVRKLYLAAMTRDAGSPAEERTSNAFAITLFCLSSEQESRCADLLAGAFEAFPDREYAIVTQPHSAPDIPLLRRFVQVPSTPQSTLDATLYVCHRDSLLAPALVNVRRAGPADRPVIAALARGLPDSIAFMDAVVAAEYRSHQPLSPGGVDSKGAPFPPARIACFVAEVDGTVIGTVVLSNTGGEVEAVRAVGVSFDTDALVATEQYSSPAPVFRGGGGAGHGSRGGGGGVAADGASNSPPSALASLLHVVLSPILFPAAPFILRQALRLYGGKYAAVYRQPASALGSHIAAPLPPVVGEFGQLVRPRRLPELNPVQQAARDALKAARRADKETHIGQMDSITLSAYTVAGLNRTELSDPRSLDHVVYLFTVRHSTLRRVHVNSRVVVVGASDAAVAAVSALILEPGVRMSHISMVCPGGLPRPADAFISPAPFTPGREFTAFDLSRLPLSSHVTVVDDVVMAIHRKEKCVVLLGHAASAAAAAGAGPGSSAGDSPSAGSPSRSQGAGGALPRARLRYEALMLLPGLTEATWGRLGYSSPDVLPRGMHCLTHAEALAALAADVEVLSAEIEAAEEEGGGTDGGGRAEISEAAASIAGPGLSACTDLDAVVYGDSLEALTAINAMIDRGVPGHRILHLRPSARAFDVSGEHHAGLPPVSVDIHDDLVPVGSGAPLTGDGLFTSKAVSSVLAQAGVRTVLGAEILKVTGAMAAAVEAGIGLAEQGDEEGMGDVTGLAGEDGLAPVTIPGLSIDVRVRRLPGSLAEEGAGRSGEASPSADGTPSESEEGEEGEDGVEAPKARLPPPMVETVTIPAALLLCAAERNVDSRFFKAVDDSGIVYDGRLVLNHTFNATDPAVFGGGSVAKFSRKYRLDLGLSKFESREVGEAVSRSVLAFLWHGPAQAPPPGASLPALLPPFVRPKVTRAILPGNVYYVRARLPVLPYGTSGREIVTFVPPQQDKGKGLRFCRAVLTRYGTVGELEYCGNDGVESCNLASLVGLHSSYLNGLERRLSAHALPDLIAYFRQDWAVALYHDKFRALVDTLRGVLGKGSLVAAVDAAASPSKDGEEGHAGAASTTEAHAVIAGLLGSVLALVAAQAQAQAPAAEGKEGDSGEPQVGAEEEVKSAEDGDAGSTGAVHRGVDGASSSPSFVDDAIRALQVEGAGVAGAALPLEVRRAVEAALLDYLRANKQVLPVYVTPTLPPQGL